jgi:hypothetical protein
LWRNAFQIVAVLITSFGGAGIIILGFSNWLGKVWAKRLMQSDRARPEKKLEELRAELRSENDQQVRRLQTELEIFRDKYLKAHQDKVGMYRLAVETVEYRDRR